MTTPRTFTTTVSAIGQVHSPRTEPLDDDWGDVVSTIVLDATQFTPDVLAGIDEFSHIDVVYLFDRVDPSKINLGSRHPRNRDDWPLVGIFAQRAKARPNRLGVTTCELVAVTDLTLTVRGLDAIDATPVLDIKPHVIEFQARTAVHQPDWIGELMSDYWQVST
ncbi:MAG: SAM-dependent methyltransferase [Ilumatobacteraceae bacterium]